MARPIIVAHRFQPSQQPISTPDLLREFELDRSHFNHLVRFAAPLAELAEANIRYDIALEIVTRIDTHLAQGTQHYRDRDGRLLTTLDQVIHAILTDNLTTQEA